jgi:hypothetical protein
MMRRLRPVLIGLAVIAALFCTATARLMIWPARGMPPHVDAIVMLAGPGYRLPVALNLTRVHRAQILVVSRGHDGYGSPCPDPITGVRLICFEPVPATTRGEAEYVGRLAKRSHWHSITLVTNTPQDSRARQRVEACFPGRVYVVTAGLPWKLWPWQIVYEWGATLKMYLLQRSC